MDAPLLVARVLHVALGVFWGGVVVFNAAFLGPSMAEAGPEGAKVAGGLMRRRFLDVLPTTAILTILSGVYLLWRVSAGFVPGYMGSRAGIAYSVGMLASVVALGVGLGMLRPAMLQAAALSQSAGQAAPEARPAMLAEAQALRGRAGRAGRVVAWLIGVAVVTMAVARYL